MNTARFLARLADMQTNLDELTTLYKKAPELFEHVSFISDTNGNIVTLFFWDHSQTGATREQLRQVATQHQDMNWQRVVTTKGYDWHGKLGRIEFVWERMEELPTQMEIRKDIFGCGQGDGSPEGDASPQGPNQPAVTSTTRTWL